MKVIKNFYCLSDDTECVVVYLIQFRVKSYQAVVKNGNIFIWCKKSNINKYVEESQYAKFSFTVNVWRAFVVVIVRIFNYLQVFFFDLNFDFF